MAGSLSILIWHICLLIQIVLDNVEHTTGSTISIRRLQTQHNMVLSFLMMLDTLVSMRHLLVTRLIQPLIRSFHNIHLTRFLESFVKTANAIALAFHLTFKLC